MHIDTFTEAQLAGQRLMVGFEGTEFNEDLRFLIDTLKVGGVILFSINIESPDQLKDLCGSIQDFALSCGQPPLIIAVDQEGGQVARLKEPFTIFPGNPHMKSDKDAIDFAEITAAELNQVGINMNMAPVMDISPEGFDSIMAGRTFGDNPSRVARMGVIIIEHLQLNNIMAVAKHFPGIGRTTLDSHRDMPVLSDDLSALEQFDLIPFEAGIQSGVCGVMLSHIFYPELDPQWPASLSPPIARDLLRQQMGFDGLVLTDDLDMGAIARHYDIQSTIQQILSAEIDLTLICHKGPNIELGFEEVLKGITDNQDLKARGIESVERIMKAKDKYLRANS